MNKKKKVFSLLLTLGLMTVGGAVSAKTWVKSENVTIRFNIPDAVQTYVSGRTNTKIFTTKASNYIEDHYAYNLYGYNSSFCAELLSVKPWYQPNKTKDKNYKVGTKSNKGRNTGYFNANEKLRTDFYAMGLNGSAMFEVCDVYEE